MADEVTEYSVRDYSAVDRQIDEMARRERIRTNKLKLENLKKFILIVLMIIAGICLLLLALAIAYRIAFPPEKKVLENPLPLEVTIKNEPIILKESSKEIINKKGPSNKIFGIPDNSSNQSNDTDVGNKNIIQNEISKKSKLDNTSVVTFKNNRSGLTGFMDVTTGWRWKTPDAEKPFNQYCYVTSVNSVVIDLAKKEDKTKISLYNYYTANNKNLTKNQWINLEKKCQWYSK